jgi:hypothetical protein
MRRKWRSPFLSPDRLAFRPAPKAIVNTASVGPLALQAVVVTDGLDVVQFACSASLSRSYSHRLPLTACKPIASVEPSANAALAAFAKQGGRIMLSPYRVVDLTDEGAMICGQILGDLGADVILVEPSAGAQARRIGPYVDDLSDVNRSLNF